MKCINCEQIVEDNHSYCPYCGQKTDLRRLDFNQLMADLWNSFTDTEQGILLTIKQLVYRPGYVARDYISGKRKTYFNPFRYLVVMLAIVLFFVLKFVPLVLDDSNSTPENIDFLHFVFGNLNVFILLMSPIYALLIWLFFRKRQTNFVEILAFSAYLNGQTILFYMLSVVLFLITPSFAGITIVLFGLGICLWLMLAITQFYQTRTLSDILKTAAIVVLAQGITQGIIYISFLISRLRIGN